jgi:hypothetical protein
MISPVLPPVTTTARFFATMLPSPATFVLPGERLTLTDAILRALGSGATGSGADSPALKPLPPCTSDTGKLPQIVKSGFCSSLRSAFTVTGTRRETCPIRSDTSASAAPAYGWAWPVSTSIT